MSSARGPAEDSDERCVRAGGNARLPFAAAPEAYPGQARTAPEPPASPTGAGNGRTAMGARPPHPPSRGGDPVNASSDPVVLAADRLARAAATATACAPVRDLVADVDAAYAVQRLTVRRAIDAGRRVAGRKIGLTSIAVQQQLGVDSPDFGALFADEVLATGETTDLSRLIAPRVEAEVAFVLDRDLDLPDPTIAEVQRAIGAVAPAIEIVDSRIAGWDITLVDTVADNASGAATVLGQLRSFARLAQDLRLAGMVMERAGEVVSTGAGAACLGHPLVAITWLARELGGRGDALRAGDIVLSGALGPMSPVDAASAFETRVEGIGSVRVAFEGAPASAQAPSSAQAPRPAPIPSSAQTSRSAQAPEDAR